METPRNPNPYRYFFWPCIRPWDNIHRDAKLHVGYNAAVLEMMYNVHRDVNPYSVDNLALHCIMYCACIMHCILHCMLLRLYVLYCVLYYVLYCFVLCIVLCGVLYNIAYCLVSVAKVTPLLEFLWTSTLSGPMKIVRSSCPTNRLTRRKSDQFTDC